MRFIISLSLVLFTHSAFSARDYIKIDTCYHWLTKDQLDHKIRYANRNHGKLYFHGGGVNYCWRSPIGAQSSWEDHGDYLIRIKFKPDVKMAHYPRQYTIKSTLNYAEVLYSNDNRWHEYTITPDAIESWSINQPGSFYELEADFKHLTGRNFTENDYFYPSSVYSKSWLKRSIPTIIKNLKKQAKKGSVYIFGDRQDEHFESEVELAWHRELSEEALKTIKLKKRTKIKVQSASYGLNVDSTFRGNANDNATSYCDGKLSCEYKVDHKYIEDPAPDKDKDFTISWKCGEEDTIHTETISAPATGNKVVLECKTFETL